MAKVCPHCKSTLFIKHGIQKNARDHSEHQRYRCTKCFKFFVHAGRSGSKQPLNGDTVVIDAPDADE